MSGSNGTPCLRSSSRPDLNDSRFFSRSSCRFSSGERADCCWLPDTAVEVDLFGVTATATMTTMTMAQIVTVDFFIIDLSESLRNDPRLAM